MTFRKSVLAMGAVVLGVLPLAACGSDRAGLATAPSSALSIPLPAAAVELSVVPSGARVSATETPYNTISSIVAGTACPTLQFTISTYLIKTDAATRYDGGSCASLQAGTKMTLQATRLGGDSAQTVVYASQIAIRPDTATTPTPTAPTAPNPPTSPNTVTGEATVTSLGTTTACPALTFVVGGYYTVVTSAATNYEAAGSCAGIKVGTKLALTGTRTGDSSIAATNIAFRDGGTTDPTKPTEPMRPVEGEGVITSLSGGTACPTLQFFIGTYLIKLDTSTQYVGGFCADIKAGVKVHVKGTVNADGSVTGSTVTARTVTPAPGPEAEGEGFVTALVSGTACPDLQFHIGEYTITVTASTQFVGGSCGGILVGKKLGVRGTMTGDKSATALQITITN